MDGGHHFTSHPIKFEYKTQRVHRETKKTNLVKDRLNQLKYLEGVN
jgi:hypothetical protein